MTYSRIGVCSWSLAPEDPAGLLQGLGRVGIGIVQLALVPVVADPRRWGDAVKHLRDAGVELASGMLAMQGEDYSTLESIRRTGGVRDDHAWPGNRRLAEAVAGVAGDAGLGLVTFHAGFLPHDRGDPLRATMVRRLREVADVFEHRGVRVAFETGQESAATLLEVLEELDRPDVGVNFDPANMILYGMGDPVRALQALAGRVAQVHLKDALPAARPGTWGREVPAGDGAVDWRAFFAAAARIEPAPDIIIEREAGVTREADITRARRLAERHLGRPAVRETAP